VDEPGVIGPRDDRLDGFARCERFGDGSVRVPTTEQGRGRRANRQHRPEQRLRGRRTGCDREVFVQHEDPASESFERIADDAGGRERRRRDAANGRRGGGGDGASGRRLSIHGAGTARSMTRDERSAQAATTVSQRMFRNVSFRPRTAPVGGKCAELFQSPRARPVARKRQHPG
jgi:hypothetical protein